MQVLFGNIFLLFGVTKYVLGSVAFHRKQKCRTEWSDSALGAMHSQGGWFGIRFVVVGRWGGGGSAETFLDVREMRGNNIRKSTKIVRETESIAFLYKSVVVMDALGWVVGVFRLSSC